MTKILVLAVFALLFSVAAIVLAVQSDWRGQKWHYLQFIYTWEESEGQVSVANPFQSMLVQDQIDAYDEQDGLTGNLTYFDYLWLLGFDGWEMVTISYQGDGVIAMFKRPVME